MDGRPAQLVEANFGFGGIVVPPGRHEIRLRPETRWVKIGALMSVASAIVLLTMTRRRRGAPPE